MFSRLLRALRIKSAPADLAQIEKILGYRFAKPALLEEALTHRSYINVIGNEHLPSYERLEFLGDSVLGLCVAEYLFNRFGEYTEGELTKLKAGLVNLHSLAELVRSRNLGKFIRLSSDERRAGGADRPSILSDVFESITGAIFIDGDLAQARRWISRVLLDDFDEWCERILHVNYKGDLLEYLQGRGLGMPRYDVLDESGPDHNKTFTVCVYCMGENMGVGRGLSKKEAEQIAAEAALKKIGISPSELQRPADNHKRQLPHPTPPGH